MSGGIGSHPAAFSHDGYTFSFPDRLRRIGLGRHGFGHFSVFLRRETFFRWCHRRIEETETGDDDTGFHGNFSGLVLQSVCVCLGQAGSYDGCPYGFFLGTGYADSHYAAGTLDRDEGGGGCRGCPEKNGGTASLNGTPGQRERQVGRCCHR